MDTQKVETEVKQAATLAEKTAKALEVASENNPQLKSDLVNFAAAYEAAVPHLEKAVTGHGFNFAENKAAFQATKALIAAGKQLAATVESITAEVKAEEAAAK